MTSTARTFLEKSQNLTFFSDMDLDFEFNKINIYDDLDKKIIDGNIIMMVITIIIGLIIKAFLA